MRQRAALATLGTLTVLAVVPWLVVLARSTTSPDASPPAAEVGQPDREAGRSPTPPPSQTPSPSPTPSAGTPSASPNDESGQVTLELRTYVANAYETVPIHGVLTGAETATTLRVQHLQRGRWESLPLPTTTDSAGRFTAYVDLGAPGTYQVRVLDPRTGEASGTATVRLT